MSWTSKEGIGGSRGFFLLSFLGLSFNSSGRLRFALAKCYKCFDNLVSDPWGSGRRAWGYNGFVQGDLTKQHENKYIHTCIYNPAFQMLVLENGRQGG